MIETILWIFGGLVVLGAITSSFKEMEVRGWSDEKLKARKNYLLYHKHSDREYWRIHDEEQRRITESLKASSEKEWEKYK